MEKGVDVKFSIDDLREAKEPEPWDGMLTLLSFHFLSSPTLLVWIGLMYMSW